MGIRTDILTDKKDTPTLSIITVNLNNCDGLQRTIDSVVSQTFTDYEWIVIDGGSTDGSRELIEQYANHFAYWCSEPDKGIYNAMNKGIAHAKGEWLQFLNSGDWLYENTTLEKVFSIEYVADVLYGDSIYIRKDCSFTHICPGQLTLSYLYSDFLNHQSTFYNHSIFEKYSYDETNRIYSDWQLSLRLLLNGKIFYHLPIYIVYYNLEGLSSDFNEQLASEYTNIKNNIIPHHLQTDMIRLYALKPLVDYTDIANHKLYRLIIGFTRFKLRIIKKFINFLERRRRV